MAITKKGISKVGERRCSLGRYNFGSLIAINNKGFELVDFVLPEHYSLIITMNLLSY